MGESMSDLQWSEQVPTVSGWYWIKWKGGEKEMWWFDDHDDFDAKYLKSKRASLFYGPLQPPDGDDIFSGESK